MGHFALLNGYFWAGKAAEVHEEYNCLLSLWKSSSVQRRPPLILGSFLLFLIEYQESL